MKISHYVIIIKIHYIYAKFRTLKCFIMLILFLSHLFNKSYNLSQKVTEKVSKTHFGKTDLCELQGKTQRRYEV